MKRVTWQESYMARDVTWQESYMAKDVTRRETPHGKRHYTVKRQLHSEATSHGEEKSHSKEMSRSKESVPQQSNRQEIY